MADRRSNSPPLSSSAPSHPAPIHPSIREADAGLNSPDDRPLTAISNSTPRPANGPSTHRDLHGPPPPQTAFGGSRPSLSQQQLTEYRETMARELERRELSSRIKDAGPPDTKVQTSPVLGAAAIPTSGLANSAFTTTSTESGHTVRGGMTCPPVASTPSYPFPRMPMPSGPFSSQPFPSTHPPPPFPARNSQATPFQYRGVLDTVLSNNSTPASAFTFHPVGTPQPEAQAFPTPNLYDLSLMLSSEPGLDSWWNAVVQIMCDVYKAERVTLAVPADSTDIENVPWGQKATYNEHEEDVLSLAYMETGSHIVESRTADTIKNAATPQDGERYVSQDRPDVPSRHSFSTHEEEEEEQQQKQKGLAETNSEKTPRRPSTAMKGRFQLPLIRAATAAPAGDHTRLSHDTLEQLDSFQEQQQQQQQRRHQQQQRIPRWEAPFATTHYGTRGRVLRILQALSYEADPLIDHSGVTRVLERGRTVALTRTYPYLASTDTADQTVGSSTNPQPNTRSNSLSNTRSQRSDSMTKPSSVFAGPTSPRGSIRGKAYIGDRIKNLAAVVDDDDLIPPAPRYEEYEQTPPSPWSQSPAPSPAVRTDAKENPFFTDAVVDEDCFNPDSAPADYSGMGPPEAIGVDHSWTVLHIPLTHVFEPKAKAPFKLNPTVLQRKSHRDHEPGTSQDAASQQQTDPEAPSKDRPAPPIAILSILSPIIPYPANLRQSLDQLSPHLANSFSLARHYTNIETELAGLRRRRPHNMGFGAVSPSGRPLENGSFLGGGDAALPNSVAGSITSPSDYSTLSRSIAGSPSGTPGWESLAQVIDRKQSAGSPAAMSQGSGGYFSSKQTRHQSWAAPGSLRPRAGSRDHSIGEKRPSILYSIKDFRDEDVTDDGFVYHYCRGSIDDSALKGKEKSDQKMDGPSDRIVDSVLEGPATDSAQSKRGHTMLHSYGADFSSTFQSLPPSSSLISKSGTLSGISLPRRSGSFSSAMADLPPPSDKLKGLILDSLPAHVFVALPQTGEIVWVNSRYLSYRGQSIADLSADPWSSIHPEDVDEYLQDWGKSLRTGEQFSRIVRIKRFDGAFRWFYARAVASKDKRGVIVQFLGSYMDIHDQRVAELKFARQEEIEASESKHRLLANLIPQIIFTATETDGITFANQQWLSYTGQSYEDSLRLGFMDFVHPEDLDRIPAFRSAYRNSRSDSGPGGNASSGSSQGNATPTGGDSGVELSSSREPSGNGDGPFFEFAGADLAELARRGLLKVVIDSDGKPSYATEARLRSKTGEYRWHLIRCVEIDTIDFGSGASSFFGSATDINDHKLLEAKLKEAMDSKSRFLSNMSHEIRTPLIGISGMVSFLQDSVLNEEQRDFTNTIQTSANSLLMIINDILDLSKVDAGMMKLNHEWFHTRSLIEDVNELVSTMAIAKRLELNYLVEQEVPEWVKGDKVRIRQVLLNVIGNAIKFTSEGEVFSRCRLYNHGDGVLARNEIMLEFSIIDTGRGFTEDERRLIFKPFSQIDGSSTRQHGGSGLGLVISRQLVELHGGTMEGTAVVGKGSTFTFTAKFTLPSAEDRPAIFDRFGAKMPAATTQPTSLVPLEPTIVEHLAPMEPPALQPDGLDGASHHAVVDTEFASPDVTSTGSSNQSDHSGQSQTTDVSSIATINTGLTRFSEAAKASGQDLSQMRLEMPSGRSSPERVALPDKQSPASAEKFRPPMYSILIICSQYHSREATQQHIETWLSKDVPHQITAVGSVQEAGRFIGGDSPVRFTHIVINISSAEAVIGALDKITRSQKMDTTRILILSDSIQRQAVLKLADSERLLPEKMVTFIYKPVKPSRFAVIFDPDRVRDLSTDWNRSTAQQMVENQRASYLEIERRMGHKGFKVLLVEDNLVNQKVLTKFMTKIGVEVEIAVDGMECTERVLSKTHDYYSLILCDLHMPRKDGYQACREIRDWEKKGNAPKMPIIALSANVMSDVQEKCIAAGFSDYITKPVDFIDLSRAMSRFF